MNLEEGERGGEIGRGLEGREEHKPSICSLGQFGLVDPRSMARGVRLAGTSDEQSQILVLL